MLQLIDLTCRRGTRLLFEQAKVQIHPGWKVGVTGANGAGKSSLFSLLLGELTADSGECRLPVDWQIAHMAQHSIDEKRPAIEVVLDGDRQWRALEQAMAVADGEKLAELHDRYETIGGYSARSRAGQLLSGLGFASTDHDKPAADFSGGWRVRLALARVLMCRSDLLLLDEPTNHLDLDAVVWLESWLKSYQGTLLLISHDRDFLDRVVNHIAHIEQHQLTLTSGNYSAFEAVRAEQLAGQQAMYEKQQREIAHMQSFVDRFRAKATKARQAQSRLKALERMEQILPAHVDSPFRFVFPEPLKIPQTLLTLDRVAVGYRQPLLSSLKLTLAPGDRVGLLGPNGAGKSTVIRLLAGELTPMEGERLLSRETRIGYFAQHQLEQLHPQQSPLQHLRNLAPEARDQDLRNFIGGFGFIGDQALMPTAPFSGGEKARLVLALLVYQRPNLLLLDEPTNHLDLDMRQALAQALQDYAGAVVLVSHDRHLLRLCCDRLLKVHDGKMGDFPGSIDDYSEWLRGLLRQRSQSDKANKKSDNLQRRQSVAEQRRRQQPLRSRLKKVEAALTKAQNRQEALDGQLADPVIYEPSEKNRLQRLLVEKGEVDNRVNELEEEWLEVSEELELLT